MHGATEPASDGDGAVDHRTATARTTTARTTPARTLAGRQVLVPRSPGRAAGIARLVEDAGGTAVVAPLVACTESGPDDRDLLDAAVADLAAGQVAWVAVTSVNAVDALVASATRTLARTPGTRPASPLAAVGRQARWAAVGPATARALTAAGVSVDLVATESSAVGMLAEWPPVDHSAVTGVADDPAAADGPGAPDGPGTPDGPCTPDAPGSAAAPRVLLPLGDLAQPTLEVGLRERGYAPVRVTAYRTVPRRAPDDVVVAWSTGGLDAVVLTSGSIAREVAEQLGPRDDVLVVAIGEPTRHAATAAGLVVTAVAPTADDAGLLAALVAARTTTGPPGTS